MRWLETIKRPFRRWLDRWLDLKHEMSGTVGAGVSLVAAPFRWIRDFAAGVMHFLSSVFKELSFLLPIEFASRWSVTRDYRSLVASIPALLAGGVLAAGAAVATFSAKPTTADHFVNRAIAAKQAGHDDVAELYLRKASLTVAGTRESRFNQAMLLQSVGKEADAYAVISQLAPEDSPGFVPAHEWRVQWMSIKLNELALKEAPLTEEELGMRKQLAEAIEKHLRLIVQADPEHLKANDRLAVISIARKQLDEAIEHVARIVDRRPDSRITYAQLLDRTDRAGDARTQAEIAREYHKKSLEDASLSDEDQWQHRVKLSMAHAILGDHRQSAEALVVDGEVSPIPQVKKQLSDALFRWSETIADDDDSKLIRKLELLGQAVQLNPGNAEVLQRLAAIAGKPGEPGTIASRTLKSLLSTGQAHPVVHFVLGMNATQTGDMETAMTHLELAYQAGPEVPVTLNNLAYVICQQKNADLDRALKLIDQAIELNPGIPDFFDTRGEIMMKMGQWKVAITELEKALKKLPGRPRLHLKLATCYDAVGDQELASLHRLRAERHAIEAKKQRSNAINKARARTTISCASRQRKVGRIKTRPRRSSGKPTHVTQSQLEQSFFNVVLTRRPLLREDDFARRPEHKDERRKCESFESSRTPQPPMKKHFYSGSNEASCCTQTMSSPQLIRDRTSQWVG